MGLVVVAGAGGMGREALAWYVDHHDRDVDGFLDDGVIGEVADLPILGGFDWLETVTDPVEVVTGVGSAAARQRLVATAEAHDYVSLAVVQHPSAVVGAGVTLGSGSVVGPNTTLTRDIWVGRTTIVNYGAQIGHDGHLGDRSFVGPGVVLSGNVTVGEGAWVGAGATVLQGLTIGRDAVVGAGAVVTADVEPGTTVVGVPARPR